MQHIPEIPQYRFSLQEEKVEVVTVDRERREAILYRYSTGYDERWVEADNDSGYLVEISGVGYKFIGAV